MSELLIPCPHCGQTDDGTSIETAQFNSYMFDGCYWQTTCRTCGASVPGTTAEETRVRWNRRHTLHAMLEARPAVAEELLEEIDLAVRRLGCGYVLPVHNRQRLESMRALVLAWAKRVEAGLTTANLIGVT